MIDYPYGKTSDELPSLIRQIQTFIANTRRESITHMSSVMRNFHSDSSKNDFFVEQFPARIFLWILQSCHFTFQVPHVICPQIIIIRIPIKFLSYHSLSNYLQWVAFETYILWNLLKVVLWEESKLFFYFARMEIAEINEKPLVSSGVFHLDNDKIFEIELIFSCSARCKQYFGI